MACCQLVVWVFINLLSGMGSMLSLVEEPTVKDNTRALATSDAPTYDPNHIPQTAGPEKARCVYLSRLSRLSRHYVYHGGADTQFVAKYESLKEVKHSSDCSNSILSPVAGSKYRG